MNNIISLFTHKFIKRVCVKTLGLSWKSKVIDLCCGTGDIAQIVKKTCPACSVIGCDFSTKMLEIAAKKVQDVNFVEADCQNLPFEDEEFDYVTMGFGLRNVKDRNAAMKEISRILKSGGRFMHLDFGKGFRIFDSIFDFVVGNIIDKLYGNNGEYKYLIDSKKNFPNPEQLIEYFEQFNLKFYARKDFLFGIISCQILIK